MVDALLHEHERAEAASYLGAMSVEERRENGLVYTPDVLVAFIFDLADFVEGAPIEDASVLDPACGAGAFLVEAVHRLARRTELKGRSVRSPRGRRLFLEAISRQVYGIDIDPRACQFARAAVRHAVERAVGVGLPPSFLAKNIVEADFLTGEMAAAVEPVARGGFSFVLGNPPYVSATRIEQPYKRVLRDRFTTATGRLDLYTLFMEKAVGLLRRGGRLAFITPDKFLLSQTAKPLRSFLLQKATITTIARFTSHKVFNDAATVPCITVLEKGPPRGPLTVLHCRHYRNGRDVIEVAQRSEIARSELSDAPWDFVDPELLALARRAQRGHPALVEKTVRISAGPATGRDVRYIVSEEAVQDIEPELLRPIVRGRDIQAFQINDSGARILVPYDFRNGGPQLIDLADYPRARRYLSAHRRELESRHCVRVWEKAWYDWHDQPAFDVARATKIVVPDLANSSRFAVDVGHFLPLHSVYYLIPRPGADPFALAAILNSQVAEFIVRLLSPVMKDGFSRYRQQFLTVLPVPDAPKSAVAELARAARAADSARANDLVAKLFKLTDTERSTVERFLRERTSMALEPQEA